MSTSAPSATPRRIVTALVACTLLPVSAALAPAAATGSANAPVAAGRSTSHSRTLVLPTGQRVSVRQSGHRTIVSPGRTVSPGTGPDRRLEVTSVAGHTYAIPFGALTPRLDPSLFDVTALAALPTGPIPVAFNYQGALPTVAGLAVTSHAAGHALGYVSSPVEFGAAMRTPDASLRRVSRVAMARPVTTPPSATPSYVQGTLRISTIDPAGMVLDGESATVVNTDDWRKYSQLVGIVYHQARLSVPTGHYAVQIQSFVHPPGHPRDERVLIASAHDVDVSAGSGRSLTVDVRAATLPSTPIAQVSRPAEFADLELSLAVLDQHGQEGALTVFSGFPPDSLYFAPTTRPHSGALPIADTQYLTSPVSVRAPYLYELAFAYDAVPPTGFGRPHITAANAAQVDDSFYGDSAASSGIFGRYPNYSYDYTGLNGGRFDPLQGDAVFFDANVPGTLTEYLHSTGNTWYGSVQAGSETSVVAASDQYRVLHAGRFYREDWLRGLLAPGVLERVSGEPFRCQACRTPTRITVTTPLFLDGEPGQAAIPFEGPDDRDPFEQRLRVFSDGRQVAETYNGTTATFEAPRSARTLRIVSRLNRRADGIKTSTPAVTEWTVRSSGSSGRPIPKQWTCSIRPAGVCRTLGLVTARLRLPTDRTGVVHLGRSYAVLTVGHIEGAAASAIRSVQVATSTDGTTFSAVPVRHLHGNRYRVVLRHPAGQAGDSVSVRVHAADAAGATITQTVTGAYAVGRA